MGKFARLDRFARGQIVALCGEGIKPRDVVKKVIKTDGKRPTPRAVRDCVKAHEANPKWRGEHPAGPGRKRLIDDKLQKRIVALVFKERGSAVVTTKYLKRKIPAIRRMNRWTIARSLQRAGLQWLRRRRKRWVSDAHREERTAYGRWIKNCSAVFLKAFAYVDGTTFFLARGDAEAEDQRRRGLGPFVWRMATHADGLYSDAVGPSLYAAKQGAPVKVWGFLSNGHLCIHVLPLDDDGKSTHMNGPAYRKMMNDNAVSWQRACWPSRKPRVLHLIQDHERCLWQPESLKCLKKLGVPAVRQFPKSSPDLNAIEEAWSLLRSYLEERAPSGIETRQAFLARLRGAVAHLNGSKKESLLRLCQNQKERAETMLDLDGARIDR